MTMNEGARDLFAGRLAARRGRPPPAARARARAGVARRGRAAGRVRGNDRARAARADGGARRARHRGRPHVVRGSLDATLPSSSSAATSSERAPGCPTFPLPLGAPTRAPRPRGAGARARLRRCAARRRPGSERNDERLRRSTTKATPASLTTSLGLGSGDFVPGLDLHLNSMLGEADLITGRARARRPDGEHDGADARARRGRRRARGRRRRAARGCGARCSRSSRESSTRGSSRRPQSTGRASIPAGALVHLEPGFGPATVAALESAGFEVRSWDSRHHYFGGVSVVTRTDAAATRAGSGAARIRLSQGRVAARVRSTSRAIWSISACSLSKDCSSRSRSQSSTISRRP